MQRRPLPALRDVHRGTAQDQHPDGTHGRDTRRRATRHGEHTMEHTKNDGKSQLFNGKIHYLWILWMIIYDGFY